MANAKVVLTTENYLAETKIRDHVVVTDTTIAEGGLDSGPTPVHVFQLKDENGAYLREEISFEKEITEDQRKRLLVFAAKCPVAKMVKGETRIESKII
jgi:putative redox protein